MANAFNPNDTGQHNGNIFGLPYNLDDAQLVILPVPWDVTVSYHDGTAKGPKAILEASPQIDFYDEDVKEAWKLKIYQLPISDHWYKQSKRLRKKTKEYIDWLENGANEALNNTMLQVLKEANEACEQLHHQVYLKAKKLLEEGKKVALLGGDHSTPLGYMKALGEKYPSGFGILQIDAHMDLRVAYEGFTYSHASIMYNALQLKGVKHLVQVGIRDCCEQEMNYALKHKSKVTFFSDRNIQNKLFEGKNWYEIVKLIVAKLPEKVYISFDIDGLIPALCPNTGTPVPGGLTLEQAFYLIKKVKHAGKQIIGFDLCEVAPSKNSDWDANVGARVLYRLCLAAMG